MQIPGHHPRSWEWPLGMCIPQALSQMALLHCQACGPQS